MRAPLKMLTPMLLLAAGCGSSSAPALDAGGDAGPQPDASLGAWAFKAEDDGSAKPAVTLELDTLSGSTAWLKVIARGAPKLQGVAFRLQYDAKQLSVLKSETGAAWSGGATQVVARFADRAQDGELWAGVGHVGARALDAASPVVVARIQLRLSGAGPVKVGFRPLHNMLLGSDGRAIQAKWLGGRFERSN